MKRFIRSTKRQASVSHAKKPAPSNKKYIIDSNEKENKPKKNDELIPQKENPNEQEKVSPQIIRLTFASLNVYLKNMEEFYMNQIEKLDKTVKQIDQKIDFEILKK